MYLINRRSLPSNTYQGGEHGPSTVCILLTDSQPGDGPRLHRHPYDETWIVEEGRVQVWIGEESGQASAGDILAVAPDTPHKFKNVGQDVARLICIHANPKTETEWLE